MTRVEGESGPKRRNWLFCAACGAVGAAALAWSGNLYALAPALVPLALYNRVRPEGSFDNDTRRRIFDQVKDRPGQSIAEIATQVGVSHSTASYHLDRLLEFNLLASTQDGNKMRFFVNGGVFSENERRILAALSNAETRRLLATIVANPGSYRAELTSFLQVSSPTVNWHLQRLLQCGLVTEAHRGRNRYLFADRAKLVTILSSLADKVQGTQYDETGIQGLLEICGAVKSA